MTSRSRPIRIGLALLAVACLAGSACDDALVDDAPGGGRPDRLVAVSGQSLVAQLGSSTGAFLRLRVVDRRSRPVRAAVVHYVVLAGAGVFASDSTLTDDQGFTQVEFRPLAAGLSIVEARTETADGIEGLQFQVQVLSDPSEAAQLEKTVGDGQSGPAGAFLADPLEVRVLNPDGLPVAEHPVTFTLEQAAGPSAGVAPARDGTTAGQIQVVTDAAGHARAFLKLGTRVGAYSVAARTLSGTDANPAAFEVTFTATATAAPAAELVAIAGEDQTAVIDTLNAPGSPDFRGRDPNPFVVQALDAFDQPAAGAAVQWVISDGGGTLLATTTVTDAFGLAQNQLLGATEGRNAVVALAAGTNAVEFVVTGVVHQPEGE
ncbi:MAG: Ig-like domain-containing protein [Gemmatimonadota bacterium]